MKGVYVTQFNTIFRAVSLPFHDLCRPSPSADGAWITTFHGGSDTCFSYITRSGCLVMFNRGELVVLSSNNKHSSSTNNGILCLPARSFADQFADLLWTATIFIAIQRGRVLSDEFEGMLNFELTSVIMMLTQANWSLTTTRNKVSNFLQLPFMGTSPDLLNK